MCRVAHIVGLIVPVSVCMLAVMASVNGVKFFARDDGVYLPVAPFTEETDDSGTLLLQVRN